jgi:outer membrane lipoprotein SlyB
VIQADRSGHRHVTDPTLGVTATSRQSLISWAAFGVVFGALAGAINGGGLSGALKGALVTAVVWGIFGAVAGALFGLWAGRAVSARRLKSVGPLLAPAPRWWWPGPGNRSPTTPWTVT